MLMAAHASGAPRPTKARRKPAHSSRRQPRPGEAEGSVDLEALVWGAGIVAGLVVIGVTLTRARRRRTVWSRLAAARRREDTPARIFLRGLGRIAARKGIDYLVSRSSMSLASEGPGAADTTH